MSLKICRLCSADSFLLTFTPLAGIIRDPFHILLDPVVEEPPLSRQCISSTRHIPEANLIIIGPGRDNHLLEASLRQILPTSTKTIILTDPATAKTIRGWRHFDKGNVKTLSPWQDPRLRGRDTVIRLPVPPCYAGGDHGEVTVALVSQKRNDICARAAPSPFRRSIATTSMVLMQLPPKNPPQLLISLPKPSLGDWTAKPVPPTPPDTPVPKHVPRNGTDKALPVPRIHEQTLSVIFSPRGTSYESIKPYATSHLVSEAALPLTALIHSFDSEPMPRWAIGRSSSGRSKSLVPIGQETALALGARSWVRTRGANSNSSGKAAVVLRSRRPRTRTFLRHEIQELLGRAEAAEKRGAASNRNTPMPTGTQILDMSRGEEVTLTGDSVCDVSPAWQHQKSVPDGLGLFNNVWL
ncbi:hypothetical protein BBK36DRAFT_1170998 [Trichoderma citrinoviride]|uniref:Uncharacterized protein n=1 Tax=Trichoderma citrinoviride TaxID=58853 RepID=A0A2T4B583_9HYPO|nr:hypothetical protein BBK36DRAFT_1170998 [Trichoderma citrinoviride]PTB64428.1 hypothetical protein BBK36DRAFT_1170998 [Trichoderma citrinoviride]